MKGLNYNRFVTKILFVDDIETIVRSIPKNSIIISDTNVDSIYGFHFFQHRKIIINPGESNKNFDTVRFILTELLNFRADKKTHLVGLGGGVVCDIVGFVASIYKRSVRHSFIPTTLLAQVDAAIGGKSGINFLGLKNVVGTINHPDYIWVSLEFMKSLDETEIKNGIVEILKISLLKDEAIFDELLRKNEISDDYNFLNYDLIEQCIKYKMDVVLEDDKDLGRRKILNFGHTFGHSIEMITSVSHGRAVLEGMKIALKISEQLLDLDSIVLEKFERLYKSYSDKMSLTIDKEKVFEKLYNDKKADDDGIDMVLIKSIGEPIIYNIKFEKLKEIYYDLC